VVWDDVSSYLVAEAQMRLALTSKRFFELFFWGSPQSSSPRQRALVPLALTNLRLKIRTRVFFFNVEDALQSLIHGIVPPKYECLTRGNYDWRLIAKRLFVAVKLPRH
jgi:hypothetical protein